MKGVAKRPLTARAKQRRLRTQDLPAACDPAPVVRVRTVERLVPPKAAVPLSVISFALVNAGRRAGFNRPVQFNSRPPLPPLERPLVPCLYTSENFGKAIVDAVGKNIGDLVWSQAGHGEIADCHIMMNCGQEGLTASIFLLMATLSLTGSRLCVLSWRPPEPARSPPLRLSTGLKAMRPETHH